MDHTGGFWITAFNEVAEQIMGISANDLYELKDTNEAAFSKYFTKAMGSEWTFQLMAKQDTFNVSSNNMTCTNSSGPGPCPLPVPPNRARRLCRRQRNPHPADQRNVRVKVEIEKRIVVVSVRYIV